MSSSALQQKELLEKLIIHLNNEINDYRYLFTSDGSKQLGDEGYIQTLSLGVFVIKDKQEPDLVIPMRRVERVEQLIEIISQATISMWQNVDKI
jgi:phage head maturation protease